MGKIVSRFLEQEQIHSPTIAARFDFHYFPNNFVTIENDSRFDPLKRRVRSKLISSPLAPLILIRTRALAEPENPRKLDCAHPSFRYLIFSISAKFIRP